MHFGIVADHHPLEYRVPVTPYGVEELVIHGHEVTIEQGIGVRAQFSDEDYVRRGARIAFSSEEAWLRPDIVLRFRPPSEKEAVHLRPGQIVAGFVELPFLTKAAQQAYARAGITLWALEEMVDERGRWPLLSPLSMICGRMLPQIAARFLETFQGGRGKLLMGAPGVAPCNVSIVGGGTLGTMAARMFQQIGARVTVVDSDHAALERIESEIDGTITTLSATPGNISRICIGSDVIVLAIHHESGVVPKVITRQHLKTMQPRTLIIDASITQGGACETSRPTDVLNPTYEVDNVVHYCVTRVTSNVSRTTSRAVNCALIPYLLKFARHSIDEAIGLYHEFDSGMAMVNGEFRRSFSRNPEE